LISLASEIWVKAPRKPVFIINPMLIVTYEGSIDDLPSYASFKARFDVFEVNNCN
jgi:hypothetical protein